MSENFFLDNPDLQLRLENLDLREVLERKEKGAEAVRVAIEMARLRLELAHRWK